MMKHPNYLSFELNSSIKKDIFPLIYTTICNKRTKMVLDRSPEKGTLILGNHYKYFGQIIMMVWEVFTMFSQDNYVQQATTKTESILTPRGII